MKLLFLKLFDRSLSIILALLPRKSEIKSRPSRILVIKLSAMGDVLCMMPAVRVLCQSMPGVEIDWMTSKRSNPAFFSALPFIKSIYIVPANPLGALFFLARRVPLLRSYDLVVDFDQYYRVSELVSYFGRYSAGFSAPLKGGTFGVVAQYDSGESEKILFLNMVQNVLHSIQLQSSDYDVRLPELLTGFNPSKRLTEFSLSLKEKKRPVVLIYPGSSMNASFRRWDAEKYCDVIRDLETCCSIVIAGGPDEVSLKEQFSEQGFADIDFINEWSLTEWLWIFKNVANLFVGNDGGLLHLAESQGVPVIGIFGPALYRKWGSINPDSIGIEAELECRPCLRNYEGKVPAACARGDRRCLELISPKQVFESIRMRL